MRRRPEAVCTVGLIVVNILVFFILSLFGQTEDAGFMLQHGAMFEPFVTESHEYYRIITSLFLHFEDGVWLCEAPCLRDIRTDFEETLQVCEPVSLRRSKHFLQPNITR